MNKYYYDLHIHSCLSPCADNDMTPNNIVGMGVLNGLNIMALTDHNSSKNCPAFFKAAKRQGIIPICGMELTTAEDIHIVCLFPTLDAAVRFDEYVDGHRMKIKNKPAIFGDQFVTDEYDEIIANEEFLLINATDITIEQVPHLVENFGGICYPAHIDREANGIIAALGTFPPDSGFSMAELADAQNTERYRNEYSEVADKKIIISSDAHYLWNIKEKHEYFELDDEPYSTALVTQRLFEYLG